MTVPCGAGDRPAEQHPVYAAVVGVHDWTPPRQMHGPIDPIPDPLGGITYPVDPSQVGQWWEDHDPDPAPGGGDRIWRAGDGHPLPDAEESCYPPDAVELLADTFVGAAEAGRNMLEALASLPTMQDLIDFMEEHRDDEAVERTRQQVAERLGVDVKRVRPGLLPRENGPALPAYRIFSEQPKRVGIIRRILNATNRKAN